MADAQTPVGLTTSTDAVVKPLQPSRIFAGKKLVVVGGTGFLGKVWVSMFLHRFPEIGHVYLLVRPKGDQTPEERFYAEVIPSEVFDPLRERHQPPGGDGFEEFLKEKVSPVPGDMVRELVGFDQSLIEQLRGQIAAVVNVAGVVDFNPPLHEALEPNAFGVNNLVALAKALDAPVMHTSTCYVAGYRTGRIEEVDPRSVPFPRAEGAPGERLIAPPDGIGVDRTLDRSHWDPQNEIRECLDVIEHVRHRCEDAFRQSLFLDEAKSNLTRRGEPCRGRALEEELAEVKRKFVRERLTEAGVERALYWGWPNIYTYTKSIGEQVLAASGVANTIVRPAVVESSTVYPFPGWNEGINTSAPFIYMALKGQVQFPADSEVHLDIVPVDMVSSGMIVALAELIESTHKPVYQFGCGDVNPCRMARFMELIGLYKRKKWQDGGEDGNPIVNAILARFEPVSLSKREYQSHGAHAIARLGKGVASLLRRAAVGPTAPLFAPLSRALGKAARGEEKIGEVMDLFLPFVAECEWIFSCANTRSALARMPAEERERFYWAPEELDWRQWMYEVHLPAIERWATPHFDERLARPQVPIRSYETLLDLLDEMAERHDHAVALRYLEADGLSRITFLQWREASATTAGRLLRAGVGRGDRVLLAGDNRPAWPIAYFGILRAGAVAVPVDPKLSATQVANIIQSSGAKHALLGREVLDELGEESQDLFPELCVIDLDDATSDDRGIAPPPTNVAPSDLASIIYTSGTTGEPKGVMLNHENFCALLAALTPIFSLSPTDGVLSVLPLHHTFEFSCGLLLPMSSGTCISYIGEISADRLGEGLDQAHVSAMVGVPALWQMLERRVLSEVKERGGLQARAFNWALSLNRMLGKQLGINAGKLFFGAVHDKLGGNVKYLISGGSALPQETADTFAGLGLMLSEGYGLTEAAPVLTVSKANPRTRLGQVGKPIPGVEIKIAGPDKHGVGEVLARGANVMQGYFGNEEATEAVIDDEGWLHTGDLGKLDKRGQLVLSGRNKDVIVSTSGENVYPDDVEDMLGTVAHIEELCVVGLKKGETEVVACLAVPERGDNSDALAMGRDRAMRSLKEAIAKLPRHCQPTVVHFYDVLLPKTATRKIKRAEVRRILERLLTASRPPRAELRNKDGALAMVQHAVATIASTKPADVHPGLSLAADLGFDSLMSMELTVALEAQLGRSLPPEQLNRVETVADVVSMCEGAGRRVAAIAPIEEEPGDAFSLPAPVAATAKRLLTKAQMGFYGKVMKPTIYGRAFIPHNRNVIVASNHASHLDMGFVKYALGSFGQDMVALAAQDYFFAGTVKRTYFKQLTNLQAFDRRTNLRQALREAGDTIRAGKNVLIFPEGTRSRDGVVQEFKATLGHLALVCGVDILPVCLSGTHESWAKGTRVPTRRDISARIGPPLCVADLRRLTQELKLPAASRTVAQLARAAIVALQRGSVLDLSEHAHLDEALGERREHPLVGLFRNLETRYVEGKIDKPLTFYFSLGNEASCKWTARLEPEGCTIEPGKPAGNSADCVLKTSAELFTRIVQDGYVPTPVEVMSGQVKSNDIALLTTFQEVFDLR